MPKVSVVVATYNCASVLHLTLRAILAQDFADFEVWIVGDACTDNSEEVVAAFGDSRLHWHNLLNNSGSQSEPNNVGISLSGGKYIAFCGHDDLWFPWHLRLLADNLDSTDNDWVHSTVALMAPLGVHGTLGGAPPAGWTYANYFVPPSSWMQRRDLTQRLGAWRNPHDLAWPLDFDMLRRAQLSGAKIAHVPNLSVLKFISAVWKMYALRGEPPQSRFVEELVHSPHELQLRVLEQAAVELAHLQLSLLRLAGVPLPFTPRQIAARLIKELRAGGYDLTRYFLQRPRWEHSIVGTWMRRRYNRWRDTKFARARGLKK